MPGTATRLAPPFLRLALVLAVLVAAPPSLSGQVRDRDARIPRAGSLWIEIAPEFHTWNEQFVALDKEGSEKREPLYTDYDGSIASRLFPGIHPLLDVVNRDADALGFTPLTPAGVDLGSLDFTAQDVFVRRIPLSLQFGIGGFAAIEFLAPLVKAEVEPGFTFDSTTAVLVRAETALADPAAFFSQLDAARSQLQALVNGGTLTPADSALALQLLTDTEAFAGALDTRISAQEYLFTAGSAAGQQISGTYGGFEAGFQTFGIALPEFALSPTATTADLGAYFQRDPVAGLPPGQVTRGWGFSELEVGVRFKLLDNFGWPERPPAAEPGVEAGAEGDPGEEAPAGDVEEERIGEPAADPGARDDREEGDPAAGGAPGAQGGPAEPEVPRIRYRTTVGARYRFPISDPDADPYLEPGVFLQQPIGDGQADIQLELYQDLAIGRRFLLVAGVVYGIQQEDELVRRIALPMQPYAYATQTATVARDLGDFVQVVASPRFSLTEALSLSVEYTFWNKDEDTYRTVGEGPDTWPLEVRTPQTRHSLGIGAYYRTTRLFAAGQAGMPVDLALVWQTPIAGAGGRTPVVGVVTASARIPMQLF